MSPTRFASEHKWIYIGAIVILVGLVVTGLIRYSTFKRTDESASKASRLSEELVKAGYPAPDQENTQRLLGTDGGEVCQAPGDALKKALYRIERISNGATGPGMRPVIADTRAVQAERIVLQVYCPDKLDEFDDAVEDLKTDDTVRR
ncbi:MULTISPECIES: hypothetical protein [unclassified Streptomyces]|uniref:hypothetical protein n=1 Tax=unclassified Streptomyces TaxID=2593676 RepID=UPI0006F3DA61|nr:MULTISPECIES: hypothetical protein [unclassified Streptomyces]KQX49828.1 hypothetical protein ASD33_14315 [Streptomyces sp. Root1304]KRA80129.1 hypothetical protein ASE09_18595 [Streptomyces sp. Root66D1]